MHAACTAASCFQIFVNIQAKGTRKRCRMSMYCSPRTIILPRVRHWLEVALLQRALFLLLLWSGWTLSADQLPHYESNDTWESLTAACCMVQLYQRVVCNKENRSTFAFQRLGNHYCKTDQCHQHGILQLVLLGHFRSNLLATHPL